MDLHRIIMRKITYVWDFERGSQVMAQKDEMEIRLILKEMGGRYWEKGLYKRVYFNKAELLNIMGVDIDYLKNKANADISGVGPEKMLLNALESTKVYYDLVDEEWRTEYCSGVAGEYRLFVGMAVRKLEGQLKMRIPPRA